LSDGIACFTALYRGLGAASGRQRESNPPPQGVERQHHDDGVAVHAAVTGQKHRLNERESTSAAQSSRADSAVLNAESTENRP
jgi:hypothetical protein